MKAPVTIVVRHVELWCSGWLFTVAFAHLGFWRGALALIVWPYYLGDVVAKLAHS